MSVRFTAPVLAHLAESCGQPARWVVLREYENPSVGPRYSALLVFGGSGSDEWWREVVSHVEADGQITPMTPEAHAVLSKLRPEVRNES